jgi:hypothetical protein
VLPLFPGGSYEIPGYHYLNAFEPPGVTGQDLVLEVNHEAERRHQPQCRFKLGDTTDRDQVGPSRAILLEAVSRIPDEDR